MINRSNYEIYIIDYIDGNLPAELTAELLLFLEANPDLKSEYEAVTEVSNTKHEEIIFENKNSLKKRVVITNSNIQEYLVADFEGDLNREQKHELNAFIALNSVLIKDKELIAKTKLVADANIIYPKKEKLKRGKVIPLYYYITSAAAVILLILGIKLFYPSQETKQIVNVPVIQNQNVEGSSQNSNSTELVSGHDKVLKQKSRAKEKVYRLKNINSVTESKNIASNEKNIIEVEIENIPLPEKTFVLVDSLPKHNKVNTDNRITDQLIASNNTKTVDSFYSIKELAIKKIEDLSDAELIEGDKSENINRFDIVAAAVKGIFKLTKRDLKIKRTYSEDGNLVQYAFIGKNIEFSRSK